MKILSTTALLTIAATAGHAATISFDLTGGSGSTTKASFTVDGVTMVVDAANPDGSNGKVALRDQGIGVTTAPEGPRVAADESLFFDFSTAIFGISVTYDITGGTDEFAEVENGFGFANTLIPGDGSTLTFDYTSILEGIGDESFFRVFGKSSDGPGSLGFLISNVTIETAPPVVPLPAGAALLLSGLGALALRRRFVG